jgi:hypothetical protein
MNMAGPAALKSCRQRSSVNKFGYMLETPVYPVVLDHITMISENPSGADNQQERPKLR